ncbi:transaldolase [Nocardioides sp. HM23]|uniref:transaldolase n=1 Tax=Nocardioides bizhenqiangii TaxID=3095076 RepID=UPI002ACAEE83|nr:transaldolase [Nocardioides sp. HM23]MDZ5622869.1 transaldolase [Nocardioides sp. HM23]
MTIDHAPTSADIWIRPVPGSPSDQPGTDGSTDDREAETAARPTRLQQLFVEQGHSPWLDGFSRGDLADGTLSRLVTDGIRGVTANPTTFTRAMEGSAEYDEQLAWLTSTACSAEEAYGELLAIDTIAACAALQPVHRTSNGLDGFVSVEVAPRFASNTGRTIAAARELHRRIDQTNLLVKVPATAQGVPAIKRLVAEGRSINVTLLFSLTRYDDVIEAYLSGLETYISHGGDPSRVHGFASFFVARVDAEIDQRLQQRGASGAGVLCGGAGIAQAKLAYQMFNERFSGGRWERLARHGAHAQRLLWASTSPKNPADRDTRYVEELIGPQLVSTLPKRTTRAFEQHGRVTRTIDTGVQDAKEHLRSLAEAGIDMADVGSTLETEGVSGFQRSFEQAMAVLDAKML